MHPRLETPQRPPTAIHSKFAYAILPIVIIATMAFARRAWTAEPSQGITAAAALQQLLNADPPHAGIYHDGIFGPQTLAATRQFQSGHGLPANGRADAGTIQLLGQLAPAPRPVPIAAALMTVSLAGIIVLGLLTARRKRERGAATWPAEPAPCVGGP